MARPSAPYRGSSVFAKNLFGYFHSISLHIVQPLVHTKQPLQEILNVFIIKVSVWIVKSSLFNILPVENDADLKDIADINIFAVLRASRFRIGGGSGRGVIFCTGLQYIFD